MNRRHSTRGGGGGGANDGDGWRNSRTVSTGGSGGGYDRRDSAYPQDEGGRSVRGGG
ncbi:hypothetical protein HDV00_007745, partial [Rhizophlyctis rosea]